MLKLPQPRLPLYIGIVLTLIIPLKAYSAPAAEEPWQAGLDAYHHEQYQQAQKIWLALAQKGDSKSQMFLAHLYHQGLGTAKNIQQALYWFQLAAEQGDADAQYELALMHETGQGVSPDYWEAEKWYQRIREQGYCLGEIGMRRKYTRK